MATFDEIKVAFVPIGWSVGLSHDEVHKLARGVDVAIILNVMPGDVAAVVGGMATALEATCALGGHNGVDVRHLAVAGVTVPTPKGGGGGTPSPHERDCNRI